MNTAAPLQPQAAKPQPLSVSSHAGLLLQRKCACGSPTSSLTGECVECKSKKRLQTKLTIGASNDPLEQEADRVADQVMAAPAHSVVSGAPPHIQRFTAQTSASAGMAPASVDRVLASSGRPLEPALRQDMEQRFGHDFSRVRVHSGVAAEQSAREVNGNAYTVGHDVVFGAGRFAPGTHQGRRLIAHELAHVVQQSNADESSVGQGNEKRGLSPISPYFPIPHVVQHGTAATGQSQEANDAGAENQSEPMFSRQAGQCNRNLGLSPMAFDGNTGLSPSSPGTGHIEQRQPTVTPHPLMLARSPNPQTGWWGEKAAVIRAAIRGAKNFTTYPDGAYWIINPLNDADRATIMTYLDRGDLEQLVAHGTEAAESVPNAKDIADKAARALDAALPVKTSWWGQKMESIRSAIRNSKNFTTYPDGAFWLINPLNIDDRAHIMTLLAREELESLFSRGAEAMTAGIPHAVDIVAKVTDELHRRGFVPRTGNAPAEPLPESDETDYRKDPAYVDNIASAHFDVESGEFWATHINGASVPLNLNEVLIDSDQRNFPPQVRAGEPCHAMLQYFYRGPGGLIRPSLYSAALTPNIVECARQVREALPEASAMRSIGLMLLDMQKTSLQAAIAGKAVGAVGGRIFARAWRARGLPGGTGAKQKGKGSEPGSPPRRIMSDAEAFTQARNARNTMVDAYKKMSNAKRADIAAVTGGVNIETGQVAGGYNTGGQCAEDMVVERLGGDASKIRFSEAIRPRYGQQQQKVCLGCQPGKYSKEQFPEGAIFESSGGPPMPRAGQ